MGDYELFVYPVYRSKYNKESLEYLENGMTLEKFLIHRDFVMQQDDMEYARYKDSEAKMKQK